MNKLTKEQQVMNQLKNDNIDVQLLFLKDLLDKEITGENCGEFALRYTELDEVEKWKVAQLLNKDCSSCRDTWGRILDGIEFIFDQYEDDLKKSE